MKLVFRPFSIQKPKLQYDGLHCHFFFIYFVVIFLMQFGPHLSDKKDSSVTQMKTKLFRIVDIHY